MPDKIRKNKPKFYVRHLGVALRIMRDSVYPSAYQNRILRGARPLLRLRCGLLNGLRRTADIARPVEPDLASHSCSIRAEGRRPNFRTPSVKAKECTIMDGVNLRLEIGMILAPFAAV